MVGTTRTPVQQELDFEAASGISQSPAPQGNTPATADAKPPTPPKAPDPNAPKPTEEQESGGYEGSQFLTKKAADGLKEAFGIQTLSPQMEEMLKNAKLRKTKEGVAIDMEGGSTILASDKSIGVPPGSKMKEEDAKAIIGIANSRGWKSIDINVLASPAEKDMLWLEAKRQGLKVTNFTPEENSAVAQKWAREQAGAPAVTQGADDDKIHMDTLKLLQDKAKVETDPAVKAGLEKMFRGVENMEIPTSAATLAALTDALSDKHKGREGFNLAVDALKRAQPDLDISKVDEPTATAPAAKPPVAKPTARTVTA